MHAAQPNLSNIVITRFPNALTRFVDDSKLAAFRLTQLVQQEASWELLEDGTLSLCVVPPNGKLTDAKNDCIQRWITNLIKDGDRIITDPLHTKEYTVDLMGHDGGKVILLEDVYPKGTTFTMHGIHAIFFDFNVSRVARYPFP